MKDWTTILKKAAAIVRSYDTAVTLRQLFYRLVSALILTNTRADYSTLSSRTAAARRAGTFPALADKTRAVRRMACWDGPDALLAAARVQYRRDRTEGQEVTLVLGVEKEGLVEQLSQWFGDPLGLPIVALHGYSSQTYADDIRDFVESTGRPAILAYAGDFDPSGEDIERDFVARTDCWQKVIRVALTPAQVEEYELPPMPGKATDTRAAGFVARHGELVQVEVDALDPRDLRLLFQQQVDRYTDTSLVAEILALEAEEREAI